MPEEASFAEFIVDECVRPARTLAKALVTLIDNYEDPTKSREGIQGAWDGGTAMKEAFDSIKLDWQKHLVICAGGGIKNYVQAQLGTQAYDTFMSVNKAMEGGQKMAEALDKWGKGKLPIQERNEAIGKLKDIKGAFDAMVPVLDQLAEATSRPETLIPIPGVQIQTQLDRAEAMLASDDACQIRAIDAEVRQAQSTGNNAVVAARMRAAQLQREKIKRGRVVDRFVNQYYPNLAGWRSMTSPVTLAPLGSIYTDWAIADRDYRLADETKRDLEDLRERSGPLCDRVKQLRPALYSRIADAADKLARARAALESCQLPVASALLDELATFERSGCGVELAIGANMLAVDLAQARKRCATTADPVSGDWMFTGEVRKRETFTHSRVTVTTTAGGGSATVDVNGDFRELCPGTRETATYSWTFSGLGAFKHGSRISGTVSAQGTASAKCQGGLASRTGVSVTVAPVDSLLTAEEARNVEGVFSWTEGGGAVQALRIPTAVAAFTFSDMRLRNGTANGLAVFAVTVSAPDGTGTYVYVLRRAPR